LKFQGKPVAFAGAFSAGQLGQSLRKSGLAIAFAFLAAAPVQARSLVADDAVVALASLPVQAQQTEQLIRRGGPFPYAKDGAVFGNRERLLPRQRRGFYREYTVKTPGSRDRGARRIVCGGREAAAPEACYYTADHYASFKRIVQ
jgi:ribonuclease T1